MKQPYLKYMLYESDADPVGLPEGVTFLSDEKNEELDQLIQDISGIYRKNSYVKVLPPIFEYYETFEKGSGSNIARKAFSFKDKDGKLLSLRYDMTTPIARMAAMKYDESRLPLRFYYRGDVFREQPIHAGKPRQLKQVGLELIGDEGIEADVEVVRLLGQSLSVLSDQYRIVLGDVRLYQHLLSQLKLSQAQIQAIHSAFDIKDTVSLGALLAEIEGLNEYKELLFRLPSLVGTAPQILEWLEPYAELGIGHHLERILKIVSSLDATIRDRIILDLGMIKDFSYYSSITMEGYIQGVGYPVANGGRYDRLFQSFGRNYPAIGFALDISYYL